MLSIVSHHSSKTSSRLGCIEAGKTGDGFYLLQGGLDAVSAHCETQEVHLSQKEIYFGSGKLDPGSPESAKDRIEVLQMLGLTVREHGNVVTVYHDAF